MIKPTFNSWLITLLAVFVISPINSGCQSCDEKNSEISYFRLLSEDLGYDGTAKIHSKSVSLDENTYVIQVESTPSVTWEVKLNEGEDFIKVTPAGRQTGNGTISVAVSANPEKILREGVVSIQNSIDNEVTKIVLRQLLKELKFPVTDPNGDRVMQNPEDFYNPDSHYNTEYMLEGDNIAILWAKELGKDPRKAKPNSFDPAYLMKEADAAFTYIQKELGFASRPDSKGNKYKLLVFVKDDDDTSAGGGGVDPVPIVWMSAGGAANSGRLMTHEICHCFQYLAHFDGAPDFGGSGSFYEMTSQWALMHRYTDWIKQESYHFSDFMKQTHLALGCKENQYHAPYMLEYWAEKHGVGVISKIWQEAKEVDKGDFIYSYMRQTATGQSMLNAEVYDAVSRFITWDLPHIEKDYVKYGGSNVHRCELDKLTATRYQISPKRCPRSYGYNGIKLIPSGNEVKVKLVGLTNADNFVNGNSQIAEWRWGFVASLADGTRKYSETPMRGKEGTLSFIVPENTKHLWLVVAATPSVYQGLDETSEWPYQIELTNAKPDNEYCKVNE